MPDRSTARSGQAPSVTDPGQLRNVVLIGCSGVGKTTLAESLALTIGALGRAGRVTDGNTVSDHEDIEHQQQRSVQLSLLPLEWNGVKVNLMDPPGHPDFTADLRAALHAADGAVFVVSATDPVTAPTRALWRECAAEGIPRAIAVAKFDIARSDFDDILTACHDAFGLGPDTLRPLFLPVHHDGHPAGTVDLLTGRTYGEAEPLPDTGPARESLVEAISGQDDTLMERYLMRRTARHRRPRSRSAPRSPRLRPAPRPAHHRPRPRLGRAPRPHHHRVPRPHRTHPPRPRLRPRRPPRRPGRPRHRRRLRRPDQPAADLRRRPCAPTPTSTSPAPTTPRTRPATNASPASPARSASSSGPSRTPSPETSSAPPRSAPPAPATPSTNPATP